MPAESRVVFPKRWSTTVWVTAAALFVAICYAFTVSLGFLCIAFALLTLKAVELAPASILLLSAAAVFGIVILWSVFPRRDKFEPPGVRIDLAKHPPEDLHKLLKDKIKDLGPGCKKALPSQTTLLSKRTN